MLAPFLALVDSLRETHPEVVIEVELREWTDAAEAPADTGDRARSRARPSRAETGAAPADVGLHRHHRRALLHQRGDDPDRDPADPARCRVAHTADEWVAVDELVAAARAYARIAVGFCGV